MAVKTIAPQKDLTALEPFLPDAKSVVPGDVWKKRSVQNAFCGLTSAETHRLALRLLGIGALGVGGTLITLAVIGTVTVPVSLLAIPCVLAALGTIWYSTTFGDYENPEELERYRRHAAQMTLDQVAQSHGWLNVLQWGILPPDLFVQKYRQQVQGKDLSAIISYYEKVSNHIAQADSLRFEYIVPAPREWRGQWRQETAAKTFEEIIRIYPLEKLEKYSLLEVGELLRLKELKRDYDALKRHYDTQVAAVEREFQANTSGFKQTYDTACSRADQMYNDNWAVRELQGFDLRYIRERQTIQDCLIQRKNEATARFDRAIAPFTNRGQIPYERLQPSEKVIYEQQYREFQLAESQAENEARIQIAGIDLRCVNDRVRLNAEELRVRGERVRMISDAKNQFDTAVVTHKAHKEDRLRPIEASFRNSVSDLNQRYRSYLRIVGVTH